MRWKKLGKIFDPSQHQLPNDCKEFAQSPQVLAFPDFIRVYFSTRHKEAGGKYISHIEFFDYSKDFSQIIAVSKETVIDLGGLGCYDEHGIFPLNILRAENKILGFIGGWNRRVSVSVDGAIGLSISNNNGLTFERLGNGPVLSSSLHEPCLIGDPFVLHLQGQYHMWYIFGQRWSDATENEPEARVYKIAHATSKDGLDWMRSSQTIISDKLGIDECQALPTVFLKNDIYHMLFCYRQATGFRKDATRGYRLGYAYSKDLKNWIRDDSISGIDVTPGDWDSDMMCYPHVFECEGKHYLLYNGNEFGKHGFGLAVLE
jgi:hypothetical protein